jgi:hypothetical protein
MDRPANDPNLNIQLGGKIFENALTPISVEWGTLRTAGPWLNESGTVTVKFWCGGNEGCPGTSWGLKDPLYRMDPSTSVASSQGSLVQW